MAVNFRRVAQWSSAISVLLLITFMAVLPGTYEKMEPMLDPEQQNMARLEAGESASVDFVGGHVYVALRVNEGGDAPAAELRLLDEENQEFSGDSPTRLHVERVVNGTSYAPVRVFCFPNGVIVAHTLYIMRVIQYSGWWMIPQVTLNFLRTHWS